jgi:hypothetical protein
VDPLPGAALFLALIVLYSLLCRPRSVDDDHEQPVRAGVDLVLLLHRPGLRRRHHAAPPAQDAKARPLDLPGLTLVLSFSLLLCSFLTLTPAFRGPLRAFAARDGGDQREAQDTVKAACAAAAAQSEREPFLRTPSSVSHLPNCLSFAV